MFGRELLGFGHALNSAGADKDEFCSEGDSGVALYRGSNSWHHDDGFRLQRTRRVGDTLRMVAAGVRDYASCALFVCKRRDFVVSAPDLERADGLKVLGLEVERAFIVFQ